MGQRLVIVPLPWPAVFVHSVFSCDLSLRCYLSWGRGLFFLLCLSVYCRTWWRLSSRKLVGIPVGFTSSSPLLGGVLFDLVPILSWVFSPGFWSGFFSLSRVVRHRSGLLLLSSSSGLVAVFASPLWLRAPSFSGGGACGHQSSPCVLP